MHLSHRLQLQARRGGPVRAFPTPIESLLHPLSAASRRDLHAAGEKPAASGVDPCAAQASPAAGAPRAGCASARSRGLAPASRTGRAAGFGSLLCLHPGKVALLARAFVERRWDAQYQGGICNRTGPQKRRLFQLDRSFSPRVDTLVQRAETSAALGLSDLPSDAPGPVPNVVELGALHRRIRRRNSAADGRDRARALARRDGPAADVRRAAPRRDRLALRRGRNHAAVHRRGRRDRRIECAASAICRSGRRPDRRVRYRPRAQAHPCAA